MAATVTGILLTGIHASRPSSGLQAGTLYSCTTHSLVYQTSDTGSTWATWANLAGTAAGTVSTVEEVDGSPTDSAVTKIVFPNGTLGIVSHVATYTAAAPANPGYIGYIRLEDQQTANTQGGAFTTGAYRTRVLNTEVSDTNNDCSLASNQITLTAGTYECFITAPALFVSDHKARLRNVTDSTTVLVGTSEYAALVSGSDGSQTVSIIRGRFTIAASKALEVQHACSVTRNTNGFGAAANLTEIEVYCVAEFRRVS